MKQAGFVTGKGTGKNDRCLVCVPDKTTGNNTDISTGNYADKTADTKPAKMSVRTDKTTGQIPAQSGANADKTTDHNIKNIKEREEEEGDEFSYSAFMDFWNSKTNLPGIKTFTDQRQSKLQSRTEERRIC